MSIDIEIPATSSSERALRQQIAILEERLHAREHTIRMHEQKVELLVQHTPLAFIEWTPDFHVVEWNAQAEAIFGYSRDEAQGGYGPDLLCEPEVRQIVRDVVWAGLLNSTGGTRSTNPNITKTGRVIMCEWYNHPMINAAGEVHGIVSLVQDVTVQAETEAALQESQQFAQQVAQATPGILHVYDLIEQRVMYANRPMETVLGYSTAQFEALGSQPFDVLIHPDDRPGFAAYVQRVGQSSAEAVLEHSYRLQDADGSWRWMSDRQRVFKRAADGSVRQILSYSEDVTERKHAERALRESEHRLTLLLNNLPVVMYELDQQAVFTWSDGSGLKQLGLEPNQVVGLSALDLYSSNPDVVQGIRGALEGITTNTQTEVNNIVFENWYVPFYGDRHRQTGMLGLSLDVTRARQMEQRARQLQDEVINLQAAAIAELSTPLIPLNDQIVVMPLIGAIDSHRVQQVLDTLLRGIENSRAQTAILDITGVPTVDTQVANILLQAAQAVKLLGAQVVLTGIRPEVAQTLVQLGVNFNGLVTRSSLQSGIAYAAGQR